MIPGSITPISETGEGSTEFDSTFVGGIPANGVVEKTEVDILVRSQYFE